MSNPLRSSETPGTVTPSTASQANSLRAVKLLHTVVWAFFVGCIVAIPASAWAGKFVQAAVFSAVVLLEVAVLMFNRMRCPLTDVAARYTSDRRDNFDIYLPEWLARYNKVIFGLLYILGMLYAVIRWVTA